MEQQKVKTVSMFTTEPKYIALIYTARKAIWIQHFINKLKLDIVPEIELFGDNKMSITLTKNIESQYQTKYIDI